MRSFQFSVFSQSSRHAPRAVRPVTKPQIVSGKQLPADGTRSVPATFRRGISLMEVLASIGVISVGLLGLASLLPLGQINVLDASKADRAGACGRAAMRDIIVRGMLNPANATGGSFPTTPSFLLDPLGVINGMNPKLGNSSAIGTPPASLLTSVPRISTGYQFNGNLIAYTSATADPVFRATDDLIAPLPENLTPPQAAGRPQNLDTSGNANPLTYSGDYTWFATVTPEANSTRYVVSIVVCYKRVLNNPASERGVTVNTFYDMVTPPGSGYQVALGGGNIQLAREINDTTTDTTNGTVAGINVRENDWVALCSASGLCRWYRVAAIGDNTSQLTLVGPDWAAPSPGSDILVALGQSVVGVYTTTIDLDTDYTWKN